MSTILPPSFYASDDVVQVAQDLLGKTLCTNINGSVTSGIIVETEAYRAPDDKACHAYNNLRSKRTEVMFEQGGVAYIYLCYGIHHLFNVVTGPKEFAHAVLIRAIDPVDGISLMLERRNMTRIATRMTAGPGTLSKAMGIDKSNTGVSLCESNSPIVLLDTPSVPKSQIIASPRVGVDYAGECASWPWRFRVRDSKWTSPAK